MVLVLSPVRLWHPTDRGPPGSSVHGILQARILERVALSSSRGSSQPRHQTLVSYISSTAGTREAHECGRLFFLKGNKFFTANPPWRRSLLQVTSGKHDASTGLQSVCAVGLPSFATRNSFTIMGMNTMEMRHRRPRPWVTVNQAQTHRRDHSSREDQPGQPPQELSRTAPTE